MIHNTTFIIRTAKERTLKLCEKLILDQGVPKSQIHVVQEVPFSATMRKSFEIGIRESRKWTFCVDADVLLRPGSIEYMLIQAEKQPENVCEIQGLVLDKFFGGPRPGGIHLYRTFLLPEVLKRIPEEGVNIRPEHYTLQKMANDRYPWLQISWIVGTHDDEQYNFDIYRKCMVHGVKHLHLADLFVTLWKQNMERDPDYAVALQSFSDSIRYTGDLFINIKQSVYLQWYSKSNFTEKKELDINQFSLEAIEKNIQTWNPSPEYMKHFPDSFGYKRLYIDKKKGKRSSRLIAIIKEKGLIKGLLFIKGQALISLGLRLQRII